MRRAHATTESPGMAKIFSSKTYLSKNNQVARAFARGLPGAERRVLERVAEASAQGEVVPPELQKIANAILGVALLAGKLPEKAPGRPKDESSALKGVEIAYCFFDLLDQNIYDRSETLRLVAIQKHASERHVERSVRDYAWLVGGSSDADLNARCNFRARRAILSHEEYQGEVLRELRFQAGAPPMGHRPVEDRLAAAPRQVGAMRAELLRIVDLATGQRTEDG